MPLSVLILFSVAILQGALLFFARSPREQRAIEWLSALGFLSAAGSLLVDLGAQPIQYWGGLIEDQPLLRLPRAALLLSGLLLARSVVAARDLPGPRKPDVLFLLSLLALAGETLILSRHATLSVIMLVGISWLSLFLGGLAFSGRAEGEAVLKHWLQASVAMVTGFGAIVLLAVIAGGAHYETIAGFLKTQAFYSPQALVIVFALCAPFLMVAGLFPFQFVKVDSDEGLPWPVVVIGSVFVQGAAAIALWKMGIEVFGKARPDQISEGLRTLQLAGLCGGFWLAIAALTQENSKRLYSALLGAQWSTILAAGALPTELSARAIAYAFASAFAWSALLGFIWGRFQEVAAGESLKQAFGLARLNRNSGLLLLVALAGPLCAPVLPGFPATLNVLAAMMQQKSLLSLSAEVLLMALLALVSIRIGTDLLFQQRGSSTTNADGKASVAIRYSALDVVSLIILIGLLLSLGLLWHRIFGLLSEAANVFLK